MKQYWVDITVNVYADNEEDAFTIVDSAANRINSDVLQVTTVSEPELIEWEGGS